MTAETRSYRSVGLVVSDQSSKEQKLLKTESTVGLLLITQMRVSFLKKITYYLLSTCWRK